MDTEWIPVHWVCLTKPNVSHHLSKTIPVWEESLGDDWIEYDSFIHRLAEKTKTHPRWTLGYENSHNRHSHIIVEVRRCELQRYLSRVKKFRPSRVWKNRKYLFEPWKPGFRTHWYTTVKHTGTPARIKAVRPNRSCRNGQCELCNTHTS